MTEDDFALDRWFLEYARPHFMKVLRQQIEDTDLKLKPGDTIQMHLYDGDPGFLVPAFVVERLLEDEEF